MHTGNSGKGFTLVEIMTVVMIIGLLASTLYIGAVPYLQRSRDTKRVASLFQYTSILEAYEKNYDTFPSNFGSGGSIISKGYCLSEMTRRGEITNLHNEGRFDTLIGGNTTESPKDPSADMIAPPCNMPGSFLYSKLDLGGAKEIAIIGANLELRISANYGTGYELIMPAKSQDIINAKKGSVPENSINQLFIVSKLR